MTDVCKLKYHKLYFQAAELHNFAGVVWVMNSTAEVKRSFSIHFNTHKPGHAVFKPKLCNGYCSRDSAQVSKHLTIFILSKSPMM